MSRTEKLHRRLRQLDAELLDSILPVLRSMAHGSNTGFFVTNQGRPTAQAARILGRAREVLELAAQMGERSSSLVADAVVRSFDHANDTTNEHRLGPIRLARQLLEELQNRPESRFAAVLDAQVGSALDRPLERVIYWTIRNECEAADVANGIGWFGGEVELKFEDMPEFFVTWGENEGWSDHFSLLVRAASAFDAGALLPFSAAQSPEWAPHMGRRLIAAECLGAEQTPHLLVLHFESGGVVVGDGHENEIGDGDDIIVKAYSPREVNDFRDRFWAIGPTAAF